MWQKSEQEQMLLKKRVDLILGEAPFGQKGSLEQAKGLQESAGAVQSSRRQLDFLAMWQQQLEPSRIAGHLLPLGYRLHLYILPFFHSRR